MVKDIVGKILLTSIFALTLWVGFAPISIGLLGTAWPIPILGVAAAWIFDWWQPDRFPFPQGERGPVFATAAVGANLMLVAGLFGLGRLASITLF